MSQKRTRETSPGLDSVRLERDGLAETFITLSAVEGEGPSRAFRRLADRLREDEGSRVIRKDVFALAGALDGERRARAARDDGGEWPVTWVEEGGTVGGPLAGIHVHLLSGAPGHPRGSAAGPRVEPLRMDGRVVGTVFEDAHARYCFLGDIRPEDTGASREAQARSCFEMMERALVLAGMDFSRVVRTWLFLDDILSWYDALNRARRSFFDEKGIFDGLVPASTGIAGGNPYGAAVVADVFALAPKDGSVSVRAVPSPLQCPALEYGSAFSRAVEVAAPDHRRLLVSGTASIDAEGRTVHAGDVGGQVAHTMEVVTAILESRGMSWPDVTRAIAYFKRAGDAPAFEAHCAKAGIPRLPAVVAESDICRDELLFEIEADAVVLT